MTKNIKLLVTNLVVLIWLTVSLAVNAQLNFIDTESPNVTTDPSEVVNTDMIDGDPLRQGTRFPVESPDEQNQIGIIDQGEIQTYNQGQLQTLQLIKNIINYFLGLLWFVALLIFIYTWFKIVTAGDDDSKFQEGMKDIRRVWIAIFGIALSWFIVTFIFYVISLIVS